MSSSALHDSAYKGELSLVRSRLETQGESPLARDADNRTPLHWAASGGHADLIAYLLSRCPPEADAINACDDQGSTPLLCAVSASRIVATKLLLERGADPTAADARGATALHLHRCRPEILALLLPRKQHGAGAARAAVLRARDANGCTPLHRCMCGQGERHVTCVRALLDAGAAAGAADARGNTPLHLACEEGLVALVPLLGADRALFTVRNGDGRTPLEIAPPHVQRSLMEYLDGP